MRAIEIALPLAVALAGGSAVGAVRSELFAADKQVKEQYDVYGLPPPGQLRALSLGYDAAVADLVWSHVMVEQGLHTEQRRRFDNLGHFYDALYALDPTWRRPYLFAEPLLTLQTQRPPLEDILKAREVMERGVKERPFDATIWTDLGFFVSFTGPTTYLEPDHPEIAAAWRADGPAFLARAAELSVSDSGIGWHAVTGALELNTRGQKAAAIRFLRRQLAVTDDEELREYIEEQLAALGAAHDPAIEDAYRSAFRRALPYAPLLRSLSLGLPRDPAACAGPGHDAEPGCARSWAEWSRRRGDDPEDVP